MRSGNAAIRLISFIVFIAMLIYIVFALLSSALNPLRTTPATGTTIENSVEINGYIIREEIVLSGDNSYIITAENGEKLAVGQTIAVKYNNSSALERAAKIQELKSNISQLESNIAGKNSHQEVAVESIINLSKAVSGKDMVEISAAISGIKTQIMSVYGDYDEQEQALADLKSQLKELEYDSGADTSYIKSSYSGIFASISDGYESISASDLENITPSALNSLFSGKEPGPNAIGKVVTGLSWKYAVIMDWQTANLLSVGSSYGIEFESSFGRSLSMTVDSIGEKEGDKCVVVFSSNKFIADTVTLRELKGKIVFSTLTGICVPKDAVYYDENGTSYVYILVGLQARRADFEIKGELDDYYITNIDGSSLLRIGSEIIVKANDLYDGKVVQ